MTIMRLEGYLLLVWLERFTVVLTLTPVSEEIGWVPSIVCFARMEHAKMRVVDVFICRQGVLGNRLAKPTHGSEIVVEHRLLLTHSRLATH